MSEMSSPVASKNRLARVRIKRADGEVIDLGRPGSLMYQFKLWAWKRRIAKEQRIG